MERIKKEMGYPITSRTTLTKLGRTRCSLIQLYDEYERNCNRQPGKQSKWTKWFLSESYVILLGERYT